MAKIPTQQFLEIDNIRDGIIILKNKTLRGLFMVSSLNFALKSEDAQNAIIYQFQNFLNSLDFSCQILVQSKRINITGYFDKIDALAAAQKNELLKVQTVEYGKFIRSLVQTGVIVTKAFYLTVPYTMGEATGIAGIEAGKKPKILTLTEETFQRCKTQLLQRMEFVALSLRRCGLRAVPLTTLEIVELLWSFHHPEEAEVGYYPEIPPEFSK